MSGTWDDNFGEILEWRARSTKHPRKYVWVANRYEAQGAASGLLDLDDADAIDIVDPAGCVVETIRRTR